MRSHTMHHAHKALREGRADGDFAHIEFRATPIHQSRESAERCDLLTTQHVRYPGCPHVSMGTGPQPYQGEGNNEENDSTKLEA